MAVIPYSSRFAPLGRFARRIALLATFMKETMACQPLLLYHTCGEALNYVGNIYVSPINYSLLQCYTKRIVDHSDESHPAGEALLN